MLPTFTPHEETPFSDPSTTLAVQHDLFPAEVEFTGEGSALTLPKCRTLISPTEVYVFTDGPKGPVLAFYDLLPEDGSGVQGSLREGFTLTPQTPATTGVSTITARPTNRCGCGSRLRGFRPFGRISYIPAPR